MKIYKNSLFLIEIGMQDIPYKYIKNISYSFFTNIKTNLLYKSFYFDKIYLFYTIRRISIVIKNLNIDNKIFYKINKGPSIKIAFDSNNEFTNIFYKWINKFNIKKKNIKYLITDDGIWLIGLLKLKNNNNFLKKDISNLINDSIFNLKFPGVKIHKDYEFIRPITYITVILDKKVIKINLIGINSSNTIYGNINTINKKICINDSKEYFRLLKNKGKVILNIKGRKKIIKKNILILNNKTNTYIKNINYVSNLFSCLLEWPLILESEFNIKFLDIPENILIYFIEDYCKYIPLFNKYDNKLINKFIIIINVYLNNYNNIIIYSKLKIDNLLNEIHFSFKQCLKINIKNNFINLNKVIFRKNLGNLHYKINRIKNIIILIFNILNINLIYIKNLIYTYKLNLINNLYIESNKLCEIMNKINFLKYKHKQKVYFIENNKYLDELNYNLYDINLSIYILILSDKLDSLVGNFFCKLINNKYYISEDNDPFFIRRYFLNIMNIIINFKINIDIFYLIEKIIFLYKGKKVLDNLFIKIKKFILNKLINFYLNKNYSINTIKSILFYQNNLILDFDLRIKSFKNFIKNKNKINNIIITYKRIDKLLNSINNDLLIIKNYYDYKIIFSYKLIKDIKVIENLINISINNKKYLEYFHLLNELSNKINYYLDNIYILVDNNLIRNYRLNYLRKIKIIFNRIININFIKEKF